MQALEAGADIILVDNLPTRPDHSKRSAACAGRRKIELSGGVTLDGLPALAAPAPTTCRLARSRIPRPPPTSASSWSRMPDPLPADLASALALRPATARDRSARASPTSLKSGRPTIWRRGGRAGRARRHRVRGRRADGGPRSSRPHVVLATGRRPVLSRHHPTRARSCRGSRLPPASASPRASASATGCRSS